MEKRKRLIDLLRMESVRPKKYSYGDRQVVVMPSPIQKKDLTDYKYGKDIDEKVVKMAITIAERMAISMVREALSHTNTERITDGMIDAITDRIIKALPEQRTIIERVVSDESVELKSELSKLVFEGAEISIDRSKGLKLHGKVGSKTTSEDNTDEALDALANML
jgi:hypothetical protein